MEFQFALHLLILLLAAKFGEEVARRIKQPAIVGQLFFGMLLGMLGRHYGWDFNKMPEVHGFAMVGIWLLLFLAGLEMNLEELMKMKGIAIVTAASGVFVPFIGGFLLCLAAGFKMETGLIIATALTATSVGVTVEIIRDMGLIKSRLAMLIVSSAVVDDVLGIICLSGIMVISGQQHLLGTWQTLQKIVAMGLFFIIPLTLGIKIVKAIDKGIHKRRKAKRLPSGRVVFGDRKPLLVMRESALTIGLLLMLTFALLAHKVGLAMITGTFLAGLLLGDTRMSQELSHHANTIANAIFIPIFFLVTGMEFNLEQCTHAGVFAFGLILVAILSKIIGCGIPAKIFGFNGLTVGLAMVPRAEICLIVALLGYENGLIDIKVYSSVLLMMVTTCLIVPPILKKLLLKGAQEESRQKI